MVPPPITAAVATPVIVSSRMTATLTDIGGKRDVKLFYAPTPFLGHFFAGVGGVGTMFVVVKQSPL